MIQINDSDKEKFVNFVLSKHWSVKLDSLYKKK